MTIPRYRERRTPASLKVGSSYIWDIVGKQWIYVVDHSIPVPHDRTTEICVDELHPGPPYLVGGPFTHLRAENAQSNLANSGTYVSNDGWYMYVGGFAGPNREGFPYFSSQFSDVGKTGYPYNLDWGSASSYGASAWNRFKPGKSTADLAVFLAEAKDIPRMLQGTAKGFHELWKSMGGDKSLFKPKHVADQWLNTQFGWSPFLNDLSKFRKTWSSADTRYRALRNMNGQWVKRGGSVTESKTEDGNYFGLNSSTQTAHWPTLPSTFYDSPSISGSFTNTLVEEDKVWFTARFKYYIPTIGSVIWGDHIEALRRQYGLSISPTVIWEATPWSWLIDWFSNAGDVISNIESSVVDNLVAKYAYVMRTKERRLEVHSTHCICHMTLDATWDYFIESKTRAGANPFGFGLSDGDLSARQWSILGALGIMRAH